MACGVEFSTFKLPLGDVYVVADLLHSICKKSFQFFSTASLSLQKCLEVTGIVSCLQTNCINLHPSTATCNSGFGILICFSGVTLALATTKSVEMVLAD